MFQEITGKNIPSLVILIPCYNEGEVILKTLDVLSGYLDELKSRKLISSASYIFFVDDGSSDLTFELLKANKSNHFKALKLSSNKGHQFALLAGLKYIQATADCVISVDADLQHDIRRIEDMINQYNSGKDIVYGIRNDKSTGTMWKKITRNSFYWVSEKMNLPFEKSHSDFRLLSKRAIIELLKYEETNIFLRGVIPLINLPSSTVTYCERPREAGKTKYTNSKMFSLALKAIISHSIVPIRLITITGFCIFLLTALLSVNVVITYFKGNTVPGWASITLPLYLLGGIMLLALGIIGEYIGKIYIETKKRPKYHIESFLE